MINTLFKCYFIKDYKVVFILNRVLFLLFSITFVRVQGNTSFE